MSRRILIAGIGNIFFGDDAFGCEVVRELAHERLAPGVRAIDFGIRSYDLAYALTDGYDAAVLVDALPRLEPPGTICLIEPEVKDFEADGSLDGHTMDPRRVLQMARDLGQLPLRLYLVGCEPADLGLPEGRMGLSAAVQAAVPRAIEMIQSLIGDLQKGEPSKEAFALQG